MDNTGKCFIFCAGDYYGVPIDIHANDYVIAADAGFNACILNGIPVSVAVGDFDSLGKAPAFNSVIQLPIEKDDTDTLKAVRIALEKNYKSIYILGGTGGERPDHTMANIQTLLFIANNGAQGFLIDKKYAYTIIKDGTIEFPAKEAGTISCFAIGGNANNVTIKGLKYEVEDITIDPSFPIGVSNSFVGNSASITVINGALLVIAEVDVILKSEVCRQ